MLYEIFTVGKIRLGAQAVKSSFYPTQLTPPSPPSIVILSQRFRIPNKSVNLLSEIQREEDSALTRPFTFSELESLLQNYEKVQKKPRA